MKGTFISLVIHAHILESQIFTDCAASSFNMNVVPFRTLKCRFEISEGVGFYLILVLRNYFYLHRDLSYHSSAICTVFTNIYVLLSVRTDWNM